ncbi:MAG: hypothetical protein ACTSRA_00600 [Promethearchaeota archaeon]|nr:MAG: hypothetical protein [Helarchaeota virus Nidhogg Meg22_1012]URC17458.1 MAG: hypothetical protein [Helarchaeota virus Nidhogg Meg22_1214]
MFQYLKKHKIMCSPFDDEWELRKREEEENLQKIPRTFDKKLFLKKVYWDNYPKFPVYWVKVHFYRNGNNMLVPIMLTPDYPRVNMLEYVWSAVEYGKKNLSFNMYRSSERLCFKGNVKLPKFKPKEHGIAWVVSMIMVYGLIIGGVKIRR